MRTRFALTAALFAIAGSVAFAQRPSFEVGKPADCRSTC